VVAGIGVFTGEHWEELPTWGQLLTFGVPALLLATAAVLIRRTAAVSPVTTRLVAALLLVAGGLLGGVTEVLCDPDASSDGGWTWPLVGATTTLVWAIGYLFVRGGLLHAATLIGLAVTAASSVQQFVHPSYDAGGSWANLAEGLSVIAVGVGWGLLGWFGLLRERAFGLTLAGATVFWGAQVQLNDGGEGHSWPGHLATGLLALLGLVGYVRTKSVGLLVVGVVSLAVVVPEIVLDYSDGTLSTAGALLVTGLSIVGASALGFRLRHDVAARD
jgi:hypothetical protein